MKNNNNRFGFILDIPSDDDFIFGASLPFESLIEDGNWEPYLPVKELQNKGFETYACVSFTILNAIEAIIERKYGEKHNYSDRFLAAISDTKVGGNSPRKVADFLRKIGVVPEDVYPFKSDSFNEFYQPLSPELEALAKEFTDKWEFKYEKVPNEPKLIERALKCSPLGISVYAWLKNPNGDYHNPNNSTDNHFTTLYRVDDKYRVFDTYEGTRKALVKDMPHAIIQRYWIEKKTQKQESAYDFFGNIWEWIKELFTWDASALGAKRHKGWRGESRAYRIEQPLCEFGMHNPTVLNPLNTHHIEDFSTFPEKEMLKSNWMNVCRFHHLYHCHLGSWRSIDPNIREEAKAHTLRVKDRR